MQPIGVIFDLDGVLIDSEGLQYAAYSRALERFGARVSETEYAAHWIAEGRGPEYAVAAFKLALAPDELRALKGPVYHDLLRREVALMPGVVIFTEIPGTCEMLRRLHMRYPLYLLSDTNEIHFGYVKRTVEVVRLFQQCIVSYEVGAMKPGPRIYQEALRRSGLPADACVFIDDRPGNVDGARRVGMHAVQFDSP